MEKKNNVWEDDGKRGAEKGWGIGKMHERCGLFLVFCTKMHKGELTVKKRVVIIFYMHAGNVSSNVSGMPCSTKEKR